VWVTVAGTVETRTDTTVVESNIHEPSDSSLLWDCIRVVTRLLKRAQELVPDADWTSFHDHQRRAKRRAFEILFPPRSKGDKEKHRRWAYEDLLEVAQQTYAYGLIAEQKLLNAQPSSILDIAQLEALCGELRQYLECMNKVMDQTRRRVINGENVPAREKPVSIFETHTDIIVKDNRKTLFGHKICLTGGASSMILDCVIEDGNPAESTLVERSIERQTEIYGRPPRQTSYDGAFASKANLKKAKELGVNDVAFHKKSGLDVAEMTKSPWVFRKLRNFRAGIEGCISALKRAFGLDRCTWRGLPGFKSYVWSCVVIFNAMILAKRLVT
jgi:IS5 family transposase